MTSTPDSITFSWSDDFIHYGYQVSIDEGKNWSYPSSGNNGKIHEIGRLNPEDSVTLWVRGIDPSPCYYSDIAIKKCFSKACSPLDYTVKADSSICFGDIWSIEINGLKNQNYSISLDGGSSFTDTLFSFNPTISREYIIQVLDSSYLTCLANEIKIPLVIDQIVNAKVEPIKKQSFCDGETITFIASDSIDRWDFILNGVMVQSGNNSSYTNNLMSDGDSIYVIFEKGQCSDTSQKLRVNIERNIDASFDYSRNQTDYSFTPTISTYETYSWNFGDGSPLSNVISPTHNYETSEGKKVNVTLTVTTANQCTEDSTQIISLPDFIGVNDFNKFGVSIYPNPINQTLFVEHKFGRDLKLVIRTMEGKFIQENFINKSLNQIELDKLESGIYILEIHDQNNQWSTTIMKR